MGQVWIASHSTLRRNVAVKVLRTQQPHDPLLAAARFEREVRATTELSHPNTVRIFDYGVTDDGVAYYAMELLLGEPPPERPAALSDALQGLDEAHAALRAVLERSLAQDPERRHQSMALLLSALEGGQRDLREMSSMSPRSNLTSSAMPS
jgi:hypothetical protein